MKIGRIGLDAPALIVLGAGATRGASFVGDLKGPLPPLDCDFFTQAQRLSKDRQGLVSRLIHGVSDLFGNNFSLTMEQYLTHLEQMRNVYNDYRAQGRPAKGNPYLAMRDDFVRVLWAVLDEALGWRERECLYHKRLVKCMGTRDTILTFNYDWLVDEALARYAAENGSGRDDQGMWNPTRGYGVMLEDSHGPGFQRWACMKGDQQCRPRDTCRPRRNVVTSVT